MLQVGGIPNTTGLPSRAEELLLGLLEQVEHFYRCSTNRSTKEETKASGVRFSSTPSICSRSSVITAYLWTGKPTVADKFVNV